MEIEITEMDAISVDLIIQDIENVSTTSRWIVTFIVAVAIN